MELGLPAGLDRGSDLGAAVSLPVQLRTSLLGGLGKHALRLDGYLHDNELVPPAMGEGGL